MAEQARPNAIRYTQGDLVETDSFALEREQRSRDRTGVSQVERGEEAAAPVAEERAALADQGVRFLHGPVWRYALRQAPSSAMER